jgi:PhnB protein
MPDAVPTTPSGYHTITAYLIIRDAIAALEFYREAFGATEVLRLMGADGRIVHAEMTFGDSRIMLAEESEAFRSPHAFSGTTVSLLMYVPNVDAAFERAIAAGIKILKPVADQFYGDRSGTLQDPFGHVWTLSTHKEDVSPEEMQRRAAALFLKLHEGNPP